MSTSSTTGLRDRKRAQTRARIEAAAIDLVLRDGIEAATVDAISERAEISPRTFFNYFESKDAAILGIAPSEHECEAEDVLDPALDADDPVLAMVRLMLATMGATVGSDGSLHRQRIEVIRRHPEVVRTQFTQLHARKHRLAEQAARILARYPQFQDDPDATARAGIVLALCAGAVRAAVDGWAADPDTHPRTERDAEIDAIEERAVELVRSTLRRLA